MFYTDRWRSKSTNIYNYGFLFLQRWVTKVGFVVYKSIMENKAIDFIH